MPYHILYPEFFSVYCQSGTAEANDLILVELVSGQRSLFYK